MKYMIREYLYLKTTNMVRLRKMTRRCVMRFVESNMIRDSSANVKSYHRAALFKGGKLMSVGCNQERNMWNGRVVGCSCHAEANAILNLIKVAEGL